MAFQLSPGVNVSEVDLTSVVPSVASSIGAFAGVFAWGPANEVVTISNEVRLADTFGKPTSTNYEYWFSAANFLAYSNNLKVVRAVSAASSRNATSNGVAILIENQSDYDTNHAGGANTNGVFAAKYAGALGNSIRIEVADANTYSGWTHAGAFTDAPATSDYVSEQGGSNDELHIIILDAGGKFTGSANTVLEKYAFVSKASDAKTFDGSTNYYKDVLNQRSRYIWWLSHPENVAATGNTFGSISSSGTFANLTSRVATTLSGGADGTVSTGNVANAYTQVSNPDSVDISLIVSGPAGQTVSEALITIAEDRKDCVVFLSPEKSDVVDSFGTEATNILAYRASLSSSTYAVMDSGWKYQYDKYNDTYRWVPLNGDIAGLCARTDLTNDPWFSPAGLNRGAIRNVIKLAWNPTKADRDDLYTKGVNPIVTFPGEGTLLFGDKTLTNRPSAFDRINVRRLFIVLEKSIAKAARSSLFEFNDQFTRAQFVNLVEPYLRDVQGRRGITDFRVVCDETNNTPDVIDRNEFVGDIYIKPARSTNFIQLNFVAVRSGVSFDEIVGRAA
jgi:phage tail sheath protein FI